MLGDLETFPPTGPDHANWECETVGRHPTALSRVVVAIVPLPCVARSVKQAGGPGDRWAAWAWPVGVLAPVRLRRRAVVAPRAPQSVPNVTLPVTRRGMAGPFSTV